MSDTTLGKISLEFSIKSLFNTLTKSAHRFYAFIFIFRLLLYWILLPSIRSRCNLSNTFKALADPTRLRILHNLTRRELCVCDLAEILGMSQPAVSHQLRFLKALRIVKFRRDKNTIYYSLMTHTLLVFYNWL